MNWMLLRNSFLVGSLSTVLAVGLGFCSALCLAGVDRRLRAILLSAAILALALPPFLVTNCWLHFLGHTGVWHSWLPLDIFSIGGTIWILTLLFWPLSLLLAWAAWQRLEPEQLESDMLVTGWHLIRVLLVPLAGGALALAATLTFVLTLNNFSVPALLQVKVFPAEMWIRFNTEFDTLERCASVAAAHRTGPAVGLVFQAGIALAASPTRRAGETFSPTTRARVVLDERRCHPAALRAFSRLASVPDLFRRPHLD